MKVYIDLGVVTPRLRKCSLTLSMPSINDCMRRTITGAGKVITDCTSVHLKYVHLCISNIHLPIFLVQFNRTDILILARSSPQIKIKTLVLCQTVCKCQYGHFDSETQFRFSMV